MMNKEEIYSVAVEEIRRSFPEVKGIYVFGSIVSDFFNENSDLDLAILLNKPADPLLIWEVAQNIAYRINRDVDLIDLLNATTVMRFQIISTAKRIDTQNFPACDQFEDLAYSMYLRFNEERKDILEDIKKSGKIYNG